MKQNGFVVDIIKTKRIEIDDDAHELPPYVEKYAEYRVADWFCPDEWSNDGVFIPVEEGDPMWFDLRGNEECACLPAIQRLNPITGEPADLDAGLSKDPTQNYMTLPRQKWIDGYVNGGKVYQFIATKAGIGLAVAEFVLPVHMQDSHALGFAFFNPKNPKPKPQPWVRNPEQMCIQKGDASPKKHILMAGGFMKSAGDCFDRPVGESYGSSTMDFCGSDGGGGAGASAGGTEALYDEKVSDGLTSGALYSAESIPVKCCSNIDEMTTKGIPLSKTITDPEEVEAPETVDVLAEKEADLTDLDKASMGQGGRIAQQIVTDHNTVDYYHKDRSALLTIYFALPEMYDAILKKGRRQDATRKDKYKMSGKVGGVQVPLITQAEAGQ